MQGRWNCPSSPLLVIIQHLIIYMEQTKIEVQNRRQAESHQACLNGRGAKEEGEANKTAPDKGNDKEKPKQERTPLTEAERLRRQKMIVLPAMVLVFLGAMWLIFAPSSDETKEPGMSFPRKS